MNSNFDDILGAAKGKKSKSSSERSQTPSSPPPSASPWDELKPPDREATVRLNVDIAISLNDRLAEKARELRIPKTELVRKLLEWSLTQVPE